MRVLCQHASRKCPKNGHKSLVYDIERMYDIGMCSTLVEAVDDLKIGLDRAELTAAFSARSRLDAKLVEAVRNFDDWGMWDCDGATSMVAWLKVHAGLSGGQATTYVTIGRKLQSLPVTASA